MPNRPQRRWGETLSSRRHPARKRSSARQQKMKRRAPPHLARARNAAAVGDDDLPRDREAETHAWLRLAGRAKKPGKEMRQHFGRNPRPLVSDGKTDEPQGRGGGAERDDPARRRIFGRRSEEHTSEL